MPEPPNAFSASSRVPVRGVVTVTAKTAWSGSRLVAREDVTVTELEVTWAQPTALQTRRTGSNLWSMLQVYITLVTDLLRRLGELAKIMGNPMKHVFLAVLLPCVLLAQAPATKTAPPTKAATPTKAPAPAAAKPNLLTPAAVKGKAPDSFKVKFTTTKGDIIIQVTRSWAPLGADRFYNLVRAGFFTDAAFFRVLAGFVAQFGISPRPDVARAWLNANITDDPVTHGNLRGTIVFATAGPNTRTTQFFINYRNNAQLDSSGFAPFGEVIEGMDTVVDKIYSGYGETPDQGAIQQLGKAYLDKNFPKLDRILSATIVTDAPAAAPAAAPGAATKK
jgi:peptidyl-prolyl cis-trans isomerase A (cyclophilin A)